MYRYGRAPLRSPRCAVSHSGQPTPRRGGGTEWGPILDVSVLQGPAAAERCFKCPKCRGHGETGWYFVYFDDTRIPGPCRLYVCPKDYLQFAASERKRWMPVAEAGDDRDHRPNGSSAPNEPLPHQNGSSMAHERPACTADELITLLTRRGLAGWAFLVRDVAAGRVRRLHLRQLPADPEIRGALVAYLHSAGTTVTISRIFLNHQRRSRGE